MSKGNRALGVKNEVVWMNLFRDHLEMKRYENDNVHDWQLASSRQLSRMTDDAGVDLVFNEQQTPIVFSNMRVQIKRELSEATHNRTTARYSIEGLLKIKLEGVRVLLMTAFVKNKNRRDTLAHCVIIRDTTFYELEKGHPSHYCNYTMNHIHEEKSTTLDLMQYKILKKRSEDENYVCFYTIKSGTFAVLSPSFFFQFLKSYAAQNRRLSGEPGYKPELPEAVDQP